MFVSRERINLVPATPLDHSRSLEDLLVNSLCAKESEGVRGCCSKAEQARCQQDPAHSGNSESRLCGCGSRMGVEWAASENFLPQ